MREAIEKQQLPNWIGAAVLAAVLWAGKEAGAIPEKLETLSTNQALILYRLAQLEGGSG